MHDLSIFQELKKALLEKFQEAYPYWQQPIQEFKGREISRLQDLLLEKVGGRISEKWFYTHIKPLENEKLPRIDVLDLLSQFVDYQDWRDFVEKHQKLEKKQIGQQQKKVSLLMLSALLLISFFVFAFGFQGIFDQDYQVCFIDADLGTPLKNADIELHILKNGESPIIEKTNEEGCYIFKNPTGEISFFVKATYYQTDTFHRVMDKNLETEWLKLRADDYAMMIHLFSNAKIEDWKKRRAQLDQMIAEDAVIIQVSSQSGIGMEMYNKKEFINKLTIPVSGLKNLKILETEYNSEKQLQRLRFVQEKQELD